MLQRFYLEPDWQSWNDRIAVPPIPKHMQGKFNYKLYKEKSSRLESVDKQIEDLLSERTSLVVSIITMQDTAPQFVSYLQCREREVDPKLPIPRILSWNLDTLIEKKSCLPKFKRVGSYVLDYTRDQISEFSNQIPYEDNVQLRVKRQGKILMGFIRKLGRFLQWKLGFTHIQIYVNTCGFAFNHGDISIYDRDDDFIILSKTHDGSNDGLRIVAAKLFVEFYFNFEIEGKIRNKLVVSPEYVLGLIYKYFILETIVEVKKEVIPPPTSLDEEDCEDLPCLVNYLSSRLERPDRNPDWLEELD